MRLPQTRPAPRIDPNEEGAAASEAVDHISFETTHLPPERGHQTASTMSRTRPTDSSDSVREAGRHSVLVAAALLDVALLGVAIATLECGLHLHP